MFTHFFPLTLTVLLLLASLIGCETSHVAEADEDHHLEHFIPHHKPPNFADAVEEIEHRAEHLSEHAGHGHDDEATEFQELRDIVNWIPELAADSDLNGSDWNKAVSAAESITKKLQHRPTSDGQLTLQDLWTDIQTEQQTLASLIAAAGKPEPSIQHEHEHDHDHDHEHPHP